jgi:tryptophan synthase beta chain
MQHDERYYGRFGGRYIPEVLRPAFEELESAWEAARADSGYWALLERLGRDFIGRPTPLCLAERLSPELGVKLYLKLEGLAQTGAHKINNALGQAILAKRMGKARVIAETGAGQHPNVFGMRMFGAKVTPVREGSRTLTDAVNAAMKNWTERVADTHYILGSALGAHPYPAIVRELQSVIGREIKAQIVEREGRLPERIYACVGGGSNSIGAFAPFLEDKVELVGAEAGGRGGAPGDHASRMGGKGSVGIVQAYKSLFLQDGDGSLLSTHSVSAGLDYAGIGPQLAHLGETGRVRFSSVSDVEALAAVSRTAKAEGILPALESAHALALAFREAPSASRREAPDAMRPGSVVVVSVSGRGDKDLFITAPIFDREDWLSFLESESARIKEGEKR